MIHEVAGVSPIPSVSITPPRPIPAMAGAAEHAEPSAKSLPSLNPSMRVDSALNLVVVEFHDASGDLVSSIPSPRELEAYRTHGGRTPQDEATAALDLTR